MQKVRVHQPFIITKPGAYRKVTVELKIHHLAVDALLKSNQAAFDEATSSAPAFRVLKQLIHRFLLMHIHLESVYADALTATSVSMALQPPV
ncbi:hypothetical protein M0R45_016534 [Rubus argutus]|uniref:Uncharacterized protein n=1 Tax=Rubus argutus TaxID=59490 RepID=A0AAW1XSR6_RUBAR